MKTISIAEQLQATRTASRQLNLLKEEMVNSILMDLAREARENVSLILKENKKDLDKMDRNDPKYDRLKLSRERIDGIATDIENVAKMGSPVGRILKQSTLSNGLNIKKISVPFGVIGIIYEARPNVTFDVFSLCLKSGNATILKGGSDAINSNNIIVTIIRKVLEHHDVNPETVNLLPAGRQETLQVLKANKYIDLIIPRGSQQLIQFVRDNATVPVIETGAGICHTYFDAFGDANKGAEIIYNAKTRRPSVCNALDCLLVHKSRLEELKAFASKLADAEVEIFADPEAFKTLDGIYPAHLLQHASESSWGTEFLSLKMAIKTVHTLDEAIAHINTYSSKRSEAIISEDQDNIDRFFKLVDASSVYSNASTAFTDGAQFGLGAEIGISTQKLHARGPMALEELTSYKWIIEGNGQIRPK